MTEDMSKYIRELEQYSLIDRKREIELAAIIKKYKNGKKKQLAREELANANLRFVVKIAHTYNKNYKISLSDIISAGNQGLMEAIDDFDPVKFNTRFITYAYAWIKKSILKFIRKNLNMIAVPSDVYWDVVKYRKMKNRDCDISDKDIIQSSDLKESDLEKIHMAQASVLNIDQPIGESNSSLFDIIPDTSIDSIYQQMDAIDIKKCLQRALNELKDREKEILTELFLEGKKLYEVGSKYGISSEAVRQRKEKALKLMRKKIKRHLSEFKNG